MQIFKFLMAVGICAAAFALAGCATKSGKNASDTQTSALINNTNFPAFVAPPLPISAAAQAQLDALDAKYKAGQIQPQDYFQQREAIVGGQSNYFLKTPAGFPAGVFHFKTIFAFVREKRFNAGDDFSILKFGGKTLNSADARFSLRR